MYIHDEKFHYLQQLVGKIRYVLSICPNNQKMKEFLQYVKGLQHIALETIIINSFECNKSDSFASCLKDYLI